MKISKLDKNKENKDEPTTSGLFSLRELTVVIKIIQTSISKMKKMNSRVK